MTKGKAVTPSCSITFLTSSGPDMQADADGFAAYLRQYGNTICGRHPIGVFLQVCQSLMCLEARL